MAGLLPSYIVSIDSSASRQRATNKYQMVTVQKIPIQNKKGVYICIKAPKKKKTKKHKPVNAA